MFQCIFMFLCALPCLRVRDNEKNRENMRTVRKRHENEVLVAGQGLGQTGGSIFALKIPPPRCTQAQCQPFVFFGGS